jgi:hypothetical protein
MSSPEWMEKLQQRWKVDSLWQVCIILMVFACTGFSVYFLKKPLLHFFIGEQGNKSLGAAILYYILILPLYNILLLGYGFVFGQFKFFWAFEKKLFSRIFHRSKN